MPLKSGIYIITNVKQRNLVFLEKDAESPLYGYYRRNILNERWEVIDRGNRQHSIRNVGFQRRYANSGTLAGLDDLVEVRDREQLWHIQERSTGKYTIATTDSGNFWMLPNNRVNTPVGLLDKPDDPSCWWTFANPETEAPVDDGDTREAVLFELKLLPIVPFSPLMLDFVVIQQTSDDSVSDASKTIGGICGPLASSMRPQPDTLRANIIEFKSFKSGIFFQRFTGLLTVENLCDVGGAGIPWKKCRGSSLPEMAIRGLRTDATKVAILNLDVTLIQQNGKAIIELIHGLVKQNITLILTPVQPAFYDSDIFRELQNLSFEFQPFEQMDEFSDYVVDYNETVALPRFIEYPELRGEILQAMSHIADLLKGRDNDARSSAVTAFSRLAEHAELHELLRQTMPRIMEVLKDEDHDARSAGVAVLSNFADHEALRDLEAFARDTLGRTPLSWAAGGGYDPVVRLLLIYERIDIDAKDHDGRTPLSWAAGNGHDEVVKLLLLEKGVNPNSKSRGGTTPLSWAASNGHEGVLHRLLTHKGIKFDAKDDTGRTPLSWAAGNGHDEVVKRLLVQKGVNPNSKSQSDGTPLMWAAYNGCEGAISLLLAREGIEVDAKDDTGRTALSFAAVKGHDAVVFLLLAHQGIDVNAEDNTGRTPLSWAAANKHYAVVHLLQGRTRQRPVQKTWSKQRW